MFVALGKTKKGRNELSFIVCQESPWGCTGDAPREVKRMTGAHQCSQVAATLIGVGILLREGADAFAPGKAQRCLPGFGARGLPHRGGRLGMDPDRAQRRRDPLFAEAAPRQRRPAGHGKAGIIDIAKLGAAFDDPIDRRIAFAIPPP